MLAPAPEAESAEKSNEKFRPTLEEIDDMVTVFEELRDQSELADEAYDNARLRLLDLVLEWGEVPAKAEQSRRLIGKLTTATATIGNTVEVKDDAVSALQKAMTANGRQELFLQMFATKPVKWQLLKDAEVALRTAELPKRLVKTFTALYARCFDVRKKSPSLKVERVKVKPVKAAKKGGKG
jgi:hypothetical protein